MTYEVEIFTDGACKGNPGPGGYASLILYKDQRLEISGGEAQTTNNRMEIMAAISGLAALKSPCCVKLYSDSKYLIDAIVKGWVLKWRSKNWFRTPKEKAKNIDLWERLLELIKIHKVSFVWVKGHAGHEFNERCDQLAVMKAEEYARK